MKMPRVHYFLAIILPALIGCGSGMSLHGTVAVEGAPIERGVISFTPVESGAGEPVAAEIVNGSYVANNVPPGKTLVQFHATRASGKTITTTDPAEGSTHEELINIIPINYRQGIQITLVAHEETHNFDLASK